MPACPQAVMVLLEMQLSAQEMERQVVSSGGTNMESGDLSLVATLGEVAITTLEATDLDLSQGFHQESMTIIGTNDFDNSFGSSSTESELDWTKPSIYMNKYQ